MTPTRDHFNVAPQLDTGTATLPASRPDAWAYEGGSTADDTGVGSPVAGRLDTLDSGNAFIPPLWR